jgi:short-subunit dehydrogenase
MPIYKPVTVITGASSGIGAELAKIFAAAGDELALVARRESELNTLADTIAKAGHVRPHVIPIDLGRVDAPARIGHELLGRGLEPAVVVNNAGFGLLGDVTALDRGEQLAMIDLNVRTLTDLSLRWVESIARHRGGILNVASVAGFFPGPGMAVYYATKAFVLSFTEALHSELKPRGIRVTVLCPGPVETEFQARAGIGKAMGGGFLGRSAQRVAREAYEGLLRGRRLVVPGFGNKLITLMPRFLPRGFLLANVHKSQLSRPRGEPESAPRRPAQAP